MIVGLLSDTHGHLSAAQRGIALLRDAGAQQLIHCGDVGGTDIIDLLAGNVPACFVFGNNDLDRPALAAHAKRVSVTCLGVGGEVLLGAQRAFVHHGDTPLPLRNALSNPGRIAYVFQGHTHVRHDATRGGVRFINPGALYRAPLKTVALLDTISGELRSMPL